MEPATPGVDFTPATLEVIFEPGQTRAFVPVSIIDDAAPESPEAVRLSLQQKVFTPEMADHPVLGKIMDNEFNPLPLAPLCLSGAIDIRHFMPLRNGGYLAHINSENALLLERFDAEGGIDPTFAIRNSPGFEFAHEDASGRILIVEATGGARRITRLLADGQPDATFEPLEHPDIVALATTANGSLYVSQRSTVIRLQPGGARDEAFAPPLVSGTITKLVVAGGGTVFVSGDFNSINGAARAGSAHLNLDGALDKSFETTATDLRWHHGALHGLSNGAYTRLLPSGQPDPSFTPIPVQQALSFGIVASAEGPIYRISYRGRQIAIHRFLQNGEPDPTYFRGTINAAAESVALSGDGSHLILKGHFPELNVIATPCDGGLLAPYVRAHVNPTPLRVLGEPGRLNLYEARATPQHLTVIRTGDNQTSAGTLRYRIRPETAIPGTHFNHAQEGEVTFAPGVSRLRIPIELINNRISEPHTRFHVDFLNTEGATLSSTPFRIINDDISLRILSHIGNQLTIDALTGEFPAVILRSSSDLRAWQYVGEPHSGQPVTIQATQDSLFFSAEGHFPDY